MICARMKIAVCVAGILMFAAGILVAAEQVPVKNQGFEEGLACYSVVGGTGDEKQFFNIDSESPGQGAKSLLCLPVEGKVTLRQFGLLLKPERQYRLTAAMRASDAEYGANGGICIVNEGWSWSTPFLRPVTPDSAWKDYSVTFRPRASSNGKYVLIVWGPAEGKVWLDNVRLEEDTSLLINGGFENELLGYEAVGGGDAKRYFHVDSSTCTEGVKSLLCLPAEGKISLRQFNVKLDTSKKYVLSVSLKTEDADFGKDRGICIIDAGWNWATPFLRSDAPTQEWKEYSITFQPRTSSDGKYSLVIGVPLKGKFWVDNVRLTEAP